MASSYAMPSTIAAYAYSTNDDATTHISLQRDQSNLHTGGKSFADMDEPENPLKNFAEFIYFSYLCGQITKKIRATVKDVKHILQTSLYVNDL